MENLKQDALVSFFLRVYDQDPEKVEVFLSRDGEGARTAEPSDKRLADILKPVVLRRRLSKQLSSLVNSPKRMPHQKAQKVEQALAQFGRTRVRYLREYDSWVVDGEQGLRVAAIRLAYFNPGPVREALLPLLS